MSEAEASYDSCRIYGNGRAGLVSQNKGRLHVRKCAVHDNYDGILIQDTGSARVEHCTVYSNRCSGIFVGYDHRGSATIIENEAFTNAYKGQ